jgi:hypothetical protein
VGPEKTVPHGAHGSGIGDITRRGDHIGALGERGRLVKRRSAPADHGHMPAVTRQA